MPAAIGHENGRDPPPVPVAGGRSASAVGVAEDGGGVVATGVVVEGAGTPVRDAAIVEVRVGMAVASGDRAGAAADATVIVPVSVVVESALLSGA
jgi:hypothetical protein